MTDKERKEILERSKTFFAEKIVPNHLENTKKCASLKAFNANPFLCKYLAQFAFGNSSPESMAKALIYPRVLGTSINTTFGTQMQQYCNEVLTSYASVVSGMDIEYIDVVDGRKKYCQTKAGPQTIHKDDADAIISHFQATLHLSRTNKLDIRTDDCVVGVLYGTYDDLNGFYKYINKQFPVLAGEVFWYHLTGDKKFYGELINAFGEVAEDVNSSHVLKDVVASLTAELKDSGI